MSAIKNSKKRNGKDVASKKAQQPENVQPLTIHEGEPKTVAISEIDFSPLNYRKFYSAEALNDFASELAIHGIISPLTLRQMPSGRYELVAGERRLRAAAIAGLKEVPTMVKLLTDEEVIELQLAENLQREDPHPMNEAQAIGAMMKAHKSVDDIAARLGKSRKFVYSRIKFLDLIEAIQEMFFADVITMQEAFDIAALSAESQQELFEQHFAKWKEANFQTGNLRYILNGYKCDLKKAPFNTKDKKLVPEMGACTSCPFNSATLKTLFPELAKEATCTNRDCYETKCNRQFKNMITAAVKEHQPNGIVFGWRFTEELQELLNEIEETADLPRYERNEVFVLQAPQMPQKEEYTNEGYDEDFSDDTDTEEESETDGEPIFDEEGYKAALDDYEAALEEYNAQVQSGELLKGLLLTDTQAVQVLFSPDIQEPEAKQATVTAKEVQEAIKAGNATPELLQAEIERMNSREERAKQLDNEKIQLNIHAAFWQETVEMKNVSNLTPADLVAARLVIYQSLDYSVKDRVKHVLFPDIEEQGVSLFEALQNLSDEQYGYLIRMAIGCKSDGKYPNNATGEIIRNVALDAGVNIGLIEQEQQKKADQRKERLTERTSELERKIKIMQAKAA